MEAEKAMEHLVEHCYMQKNFWEKNEHVLGRLKKYDQYSICINKLIDPKFIYLFFQKSSSPTIVKEKPITQIKKHKMRFVT